MITALVVYSLGAGYGATICSRLTGTVSPDNEGLLYSMMSALESVGALVVVWTIRARDLVSAAAP